MNQPHRNALAEEIIRMIQINRAAINGLEFGSLILRVHEGRLVEITAAQNLRLTAGTQLCPLLLRDGTAEAKS